MTSITNRLELLTLKVQTLLTTIPQNYFMLLLQLNSNLNYLLQDKTQLSATTNSLNKINMKNGREFQQQTKQKLNVFLKTNAKTKTKRGNSYENIMNTQQ